MKGSTHLAGGLMVGALIYTAMPAHTTIYAGAAAAGLAALAPDWIQINLPGASSVVRGITGHRGISHWAITALVVGGMVYVIWPNLAPYVLAGWLSHIILDLISGGVSALWPWPGRITLANIKTGSGMDSLVGAAGLVLAGTIILGNILGSLP